MNWRDINAQYVREGEVLIDSALIGDWWTELSFMNKNKEGHPYEYPDTFMKWISLLKTIFQRPYRQLEGFLKGLSKYLPIPYVPDYKTIERRLKKLGLNLVQDFVNPNQNMVIAVDSSGIKVANRSDWIRHKWKVKRGWLKLHVAVDVKSHQIINAIVTTEETGDAIVAEHMINEILKKSKFKKLLADGAYDKSTIFDLLKANQIEPAIKTRKGATTNKGSKLRRQEVRMKINLSEEYWKKSKSYGDRWNIEIWFSAYKRRFGEQISSLSWKGIVQEIMRNIITLNWIYQKRCEL
jgi:hypothetical protein